MRKIVFVISSLLFTSQFIELMWLLNSSYLIGQKMLLFRFSLCYAIFHLIHTSKHPILNKLWFIHGNTNSILSSQFVLFISTNRGSPKGTNNLLVLEIARALGRVSREDLTLRGAGAKNRGAWKLPGRKTSRTLYTYELRFPCRAMKL